MKRPTIADLARAAGVSVSTVDRVLNGRDPVRLERAERVLTAAQAIGFRATGLLRHRLGPERPPRLFGFLLQQEAEPFYQGLGRAIAEATRTSPLIRGQARVDYVSDFDPAAVARRLIALGRAVDAVGVVTADHPRIAEAIAALRQRGVPVVALVTDLTAPDRAGYVGLDHWKAGRTAAWAIATACQAPGAVGILIGNHRYLAQDTADAGCRSYLREHAPHLAVLDALANFEEPRYAYENTLELLRRNPGLSALYCTAGGVGGAMRALKDAAPGRRLFTVARELTPETRTGLIEGLLGMVVSHPLARFAQAAVDALVRATAAGRALPFDQTILPFDIHTPENV